VGVPTQNEIGSPLRAFGRDGWYVIEGQTESLTANLTEGGLEIRVIGGVIVDADNSDVFATPR
jgi:hypothetical protein